MNKAVYQSFEASSEPEKGPERLIMLRDQMRKSGVDAFLIPRADVHQGEYVAPADERLAWLTGFTGSAGFCAVTITDVEQLAGAMTEQLAALFDQDPRARARVMGIKRAS